MIFICDWCGSVSCIFVKFPTSDFYIENGKVHTQKSHMNICQDCLFKEMERDE